MSEERQQVKENINLKNPNSKLLKSVYYPKSRFIIQQQQQQGRGHQMDRRSSSRGRDRSPQFSPKQKRSESRDKESDRDRDEKLSQHSDKKRRWGDQEVNNFETKDRDLSLEKSKEQRGNCRENSSDSAGNREGNSLYVANLSKKVKDSDLQELFERYGKLQRCGVVFDPITNESRGFAFVVYEKFDQANEALEKLNQFEFFGSKMKVEKSKRVKPREATPGRYMGKAQRQQEPFSSSRFERRNGSPSFRGRRDGGNRAALDDERPNRRLGERDHNERFRGRNYDDERGGHKRNERTSTSPFQRRRRDEFVLGDNHQKGKDGHSRFNDRSRGRENCEERPFPRSRDLKDDFRGDRKRFETKNGDEKQPWNSNRRLNGSRDRGFNQYQRSYPKSKAEARRFSRSRSRSFENQVGSQGNNRFAEAGTGGKESSFNSNNQRCGFGGGYKSSNRGYDERNNRQKWGDQKRVNAEDDLQNGSKIRKSSQEW